MPSITTKDPTNLAALTALRDLKNAIHVGHSTGGGEVTRHLGPHGESRVTKQLRQAPY